MEMFLILVFASLVVGGGSALLLEAATRGAGEPEARPEPRPLAVSPSRFFVASDARPPEPRAHPIPVEVLVSQIEHHVRLEQAAMEAFLEAPNVQSLHSRTTSSLVN
jgi:hypothetical protein